MGYYNRRGLSQAMQDDGLLLFLTGAGISTASGIPDFSNPSTWWEWQGRRIEPLQMATQRMFQVHPDWSWSWYLYRRALVHRSRPNEAHQALVQLEQLLGDRFLLITQNVDGLHLRAGNSGRRTFQIHGNLDYHRCTAGCPEVKYLREDLLNPNKELLSRSVLNQLRCGECGSLTRPHILWFDEQYDEMWFRWQSSLEAASQASLLAVIGSSGNTNLPRRVAETAGEKAFLVNIDLKDNWFSQLVTSRRGIQLNEPALLAVPRFAQLVKAARL